MTMYGKKEVDLLTVEKEKEKEEVGSKYLGFLHKLAVSYKDDMDAIELITDLIHGYGEYVDHVNKMEGSIVMAKFRLSAEDYRQTIMNLDMTRKNIHNGIIASTKIVNRLCNLVDLPLFFDGDTSDRVSVGDFAKDVVVDIFDNRRR